MSTPTLPDPYRIKRILNKLETAWASMPEKDWGGMLLSTRLAFICEFEGTDAHMEETLDIYLKEHNLDNNWKS